MSTPLFRRVIVANRGEIARRIFRTAGALGAETVALFADDDARSPHVREADFAVALGNGPLADTYLNIDKVVAAARTARADALHPGYGFLSENAALAQACLDAGIAWVGPPPGAMATMGHKSRAKEAVKAQGVPVLDDHEVGNDRDATHRAAAAIGFPILVKASAGGGGRGMRLVERVDELDAALEGASREAISAFGNGDVFLERFVRQPRHVEVQIMADRHGQVLHFFDRECSIQRRHQKVIEEAPAVLVEPERRAAMWTAAIAAARSVGYEGAGTVEFLVDESGFYFLEMNTRLQVEHGVSELITGSDLVALQFTVAAGQPLELRQDQIGARGHAIELRICAEVPSEGFRPSPGRVRHLHWPHGRGIRVDAAVESGSEISPAYDSLVAKVMVHGADRAEAVHHVTGALDDIELDGPSTNVEFLRAIVTAPQFVEGNVSIEFIDTFPTLAQGTDRSVARLDAARAVAFALEWQRSRRSLDPSLPPSWRNVGRTAHRDVLADGSGMLGLSLSRRRGECSVSVTVDDETTTDEVIGVVEPRRRGHLSVALTRGGLLTNFGVRLYDDMAAVNGPAGQFSFTRPGQDFANLGGTGSGECRAPLPGSVTKVLVSLGDNVVVDQPLVVLEAMKMEHTLRSSAAGTVSALMVAVGQQVDMGDVLVVVEAP